MSPQTILVHLTDKTSTDRLLQIAVRIAGGVKPHIVGLVVVPAPIYLPVGTPGQPDPIVLDAPRAGAEAFVAAIRPVFEAAIGAAGCSGEIALADDAEASASEALVQHAAAVDMVIVNQVPSGWSRLEQAEAPDSVALDCGRPVLVVPETASGVAFGTRVLVAWDGSREAARALFDALPLLKVADAVRVMWIAPESDPYLANGLQLVDVLATLARHGIVAEAKSEAHPRGAAGAVLLTEAEKFGADLLVMGCYGHSRLLEFVLGGVTRHVLETAKMPVLMSH